MSFRTMTCMQAQAIPNFRSAVLDHFPVHAHTKQHMSAPDAACQLPASNAEITACLMRASKTADEQLNKTYADSEKYCPQTSKKICRQHNECGSSSAMQIDEGGSSNGGSL